MTADRQDPSARAARLLNQVNSGVTTVSGRVSRGGAAAVVAGGRPTLLA